MKERHEKETALKTERDMSAKDAADREAANQVQMCACTFRQLGWHWSAQCCRVNDPCSCHKSIWFARLKHLPDVNALYSSSTFIATQLVAGASCDRHHDSRRPFDYTEIILHLGCV